MTIFFLIPAVILAAGAWCIAARAGEAENVCKYGYIQEEENKNDN